MTNTTQTEQEIIAALFKLAMTQPSYELDVFVAVSGHVKSVCVSVVKGCTYEKGEDQNLLLNVTIYQRSKTFKQELRTALSNVLTIISENNIQGAA